MELMALILVLVGSVFHLGWNILTKKAEDKLAFLWLAVLPPSFVASVILFFYYKVPQEAFWYVVATIVVHAFYFWSLTSAYKFADLSFVYPYGRGIGALFAALGGIFIYHERPSTLGMIGIGLTVVGTFIEPLFSKMRVKTDIKGIALTILSGLVIASYLLIDKVGVTLMNTPLYLSLMLFGAAVILAPLMVVNKRALNELRLSFWRPFFGGLLLFSAYGLILFAMEKAPISYVVAARTSGIVLSGIAGILFFKESLGRPRWFAIFIICLGVFFTGIA